MRAANKHVTVREAFTVSEVVRDLALEDNDQYLHGIRLISVPALGKTDRRVRSIEYRSPTVLFSSYSDYASALAVIQTADARNVLNWIKSGWDSTAISRRVDSFIEYAEKVLRWTETLTIKPVGFYLPDQDMLKLEYNWSDTGAKDWVYLEATSSSRPFNKYVYDFTCEEVVDTEMKYVPIFVERMGGSVKVVAGDDVMYFSSATKAGFILDKCLGQ